MNKSIKGEKLEILKFRVLVLFLVGFMAISLVSALDSNPPIVLLSSSAGISLSLGQTTTISCIAADDVAMQSVLVTVDGSYLCSGIDSCSASYTMATSTTKAVICNAIDTSNNTAGTALTLSISGSAVGGGAGGGASGGGGGGGGARSSIAAEIEFSKVILNQNEEIEINCMGYPSYELMDYLITVTNPNKEQFTSEESDYIFTNTNEIGTYNVSCEVTNSSGASFLESKLFYVALEGFLIKNIPIGSGIVNPIYGFNWYLDNIPNFNDNEVLVLRDEKGKGASIVSSLGSHFIGSGIEDDYETNVFMEASSTKAIRYYYLFDAVNLTSMSKENPLEIEFLGKNYKIIEVYDNGIKLSLDENVWVPENFELDEIKEINGKQVGLVGVKDCIEGEGFGYDGTVEINVDGIIEEILNEETRIINGIEIKNNGAWCYEGLPPIESEEDVAHLVIKHSEPTYFNGDSFIGGDGICSNEDPEDPDCWEWNLKNLLSGQETSITKEGGIIENGIIFGITSDFIINDDGDNPPGVGDCLSLPNEYALICLNSLTDAEYKDYNLELTEIDLNEFELGIKKAVNINSDGLMVLKQCNLVTEGECSELQTNNIWLVYESGYFKVFYDNNGIKYAGDINEVPYGGEFGGAIDVANFVSLNNMDLFFMFGYDETYDHFELRLRPFDPIYLPGYIDDISISYYLSENEINSLGEIPLTKEANELRWGSFNKLNENIRGLGTKDEDHKSMYGIVIKNPFQNGAEDKVRLSIPDEQILAQVIINGKEVIIPITPTPAPSGGSSGGSGGGNHDYKNIVPTKPMVTPVAAPTNPTPTITPAPVTSTTPTDLTSITGGAVSGVNEGISSIGQAIKEFFVTIWNWIANLF